MEENMKLFRKILIFALLLVSSFVLISCTKTTTVVTEVTTTAEDLSAVFDRIGFAQDTYEYTYDGSEYAVYLDNVPDGAEVSYYRNAKTEPGTYGVLAVVEYRGEKKSYNATLIINKIQSVLEVADNQTLINYGGVLPAYTLSNDDQSLNISKLYIPGVYVLDLYAIATKHYEQSNTVKVTVVVNEGNNLGVVFSSEKFIYDGNEHTLLASNVPEGYTCEYENNARTEVGDNYALCKVYDASDNLALTINAVLTVDYEDNAAFGTWLDNFFVEYLGNDYISWNIYTADSAAFGLERNAEDKAVWYTYEKYDATDIEEAYSDFSGYMDELDSFSTQQLSEDDLVSYNRVYSFLEYYTDFYSAATPDSLLMDLHYVDSFGGYPADFETYFRAYTLRKEADVIDMIDYINSLPDAFASYIDYVSDRADAGYALSNYTITEMISYLDSVFEQGASYYLPGELVNKINAADFLTDAQKETYAAEINSAFEDSFMPAFEALATDLADYADSLVGSEGYWAVYGEKAAAKYEADLRDLLGLYNITMEEYKTKLDSYMNQTRRGFASANSAYTGLSGDASTLAKAIVNGSTVLITTSVEKGMEESYIDFLINDFAPTIVPSLKSTPEVDISYMDDAAAAVSNAVAYYMKSALDNTTSEFITLNRKNLGSDKTDTLSTLAHEGYPGHLYEYVYNKELNISNIAKIMTYTGHAEGWATYVQLKLYDYLKTHNNKTADMQSAIAAALDYLYYNQLMGFLLYTEMDYAINYEGADVDRVGDLLTDYGYNSSYAQDLFRTLIEMPTQYAAYGFGQAYMLELHKDAEEELGGLYNEVDFNRVLLSHGWCSLDELKDISTQYISDIEFMYGE